MNKFKRAILASLVASGTLLALMSPVAHAVDGIVNFSGNITDVACDINGQAPGAGNVTNVDRISGNLMLMGPSEAKGVQIQIFNNSAANTTKIPLGSVEAAPQKATVLKNTATLKYKASYVSTEKTVTAGTGLSHIRYLLAYE
ncbi:fimbrial protein [Pseudomonas aeruginosa]|uniref:fimbrial protein n=1 Tax=Pseudomonas aeruginosa TaxID=287 RepID=UPI003753FADB